MESNIRSLVHFLDKTEQPKATEHAASNSWDEHARNPLLESLCAVLDEIVTLADAQQIQRNITDWPFEHFWSNPYETQHSRLLGYFIDPDREHGCGLFLLGRLFKSLQAAGALPTSWPLPGVGCQVFVEREYIDLLITNEHSEGKYAVIVENKINGAVNQPQQLQTYVRNVLQKGFKGEEIQVFYLPLRAHHHPDKEDLSLAQSLGARYGQITFETHILRWLDDVLDENVCADWPDNMRRGMRENLSHYRNLITFLIKRQKEMTIDEQILGRIQVADENNARPEWATVKRLKESSASLQRCLESVARGELLLKTQKLLAEQGVQAEFYSGEGQPVIPPLTSAYDKRFEHETNLCVKVSEAVMISFGGYSEESPGEIFYEGYMRCGEGSVQTRQGSVILSEARKWLPNLMTNLPWYAWGWNTEIDYRNCRDSSIAIQVAQKLLERREQLRRVLP